MVRYTSREIIVVFCNDITPAQAEKVIADLGLSVKDTVGSGNIYLIAVPAGSEQEWVKNLKKLPSVRFVERNATIALQHLQ